jgi:3-deoxy-D-manno-octulosonic acid kinase
MLFTDRLDKRPYIWMSSERIKTHSSYCFESLFNLSDQQLNYLIKLFNKPTKGADSVLGGRSSVTVDSVPGIGSVVVKHYTRGGFLGNFVKKRYLKWGKTRCELEYELLKKVKNLGISTPELVACSFKGSLFYKAWLVTKEIKNHKTLASLSCTDETLSAAIMEKLVDQVVILIKNNILHVDLHPGNVLVDEDGRVFIVDFDKGGVYLKGKNNLQDRYLARWQRSVIKHGLPEMLIKTMKQGLLEKALK